MAENNICKDHSGCISDISHLQSSDSLQWREINSMKKWLIATLTSSIFSLIGIVVMLLLKVNGGG